MKQQIKFKNVTEADFNYNYKRQIEKKLSNIKSNGISKKNKKHILDFIRSCVNEGLSNARVSFYLDKLKIIGELINEDFDKCKKEDIEDFVTEINNRYDNAETRRAFIVTIKKFYRYLTDEDNPKVISWIKAKNYTKTANRRKQSDRIDNILVPEEVELMIGGADKPRDRALLGVLYYSAGRIGDLIACRIKDIKFEEYKTTIKLNGKTGARVVPVTECSKLLKDWLEYHPLKDNKESYLWVRLADLNRVENLKQFKGKKKPKVEFKNEHISIRYVEKLIKEIAGKVGITKKVNPHNWRTSRLTGLANLGLGEDALKLFAGHSKTSNVTRQYIHMSTDDLNNQMNKIHGIKNGEENKEELKGCFRCGHLNRYTLSVCENCGLSLELKDSSEKDQDKRKEVLIYKMFKEVVKDDTFQKALARYFIDRGMEDYVKELAEVEQ